MLGQNPATSAEVPPGTFALVQCPDFRCLAYFDHQGQWRDHKTKEVLPQVLDIIEIVIR
jgi:hypothetical protein